MGDGSLSQDEIDALLQGADDMLSPAGPAQHVDMGAAAGGSISPAEQNAIRETVSSIISSVAPALSGYLGGKNISISNAVIEVKSPDAIRADFPSHYIQVAMDYSGIVNGKKLNVFNYADAGSISSLMMGDESGAAPAEMSDAHQSTVQEFTNQLLSSMATQLGNKLGGGVNTTPALLSQVTRSSALQLPAGNECIKITYDLKIEGVVNSKLYHIIDTNLGNGLSSGAGVTQQVSYGPRQTFQQQAPQVGISPVKFPPLDEGLAQGIWGNISLLLDVPMTLTVELGRTTQLVQDILETVRELCHLFKPEERGCSLDGVDCPEDRVQQVRVVLQQPVDPQHVRNQVVGKHGQIGQVAEARVRLQYPASKGAFAYEFHFDSDQISLTVDTDKSAVHFHVLLPEGAEVQKVVIDRVKIDFDLVKVENSKYADFHAKIRGKSQVKIILV